MFYIYIVYIFIYIYIYLFCEDKIKDDQSHLFIFSAGQFFKNNTVIAGISESCICWHFENYVC